MECQPLRLIQNSKSKSALWLTGFVHSSATTTAWKRSLVSTVAFDAQ
jgi:hypothetical protein